MPRLVAPEILDTLSPADPRAIRSRRDLRLINWFMRGESWILAQLEELAPTKIIELGAGTGALTNRIAEKFPDVEVIGVDLMPRPVGLSDQACWSQQDVMAYSGYEKGSVVVANLFIHHLPPSDLQALGQCLSEVKGLLLAEPYRGAVPKLMGKCLFPFINDVTRYDMMVSIDAGFRRGELESYFPERLQWQESTGLFGGLRSKGGRL